jgi:hypothetical protein
MQGLAAHVSVASGPDAVRGPSRRTPVLVLALLSVLAAPAAANRWSTRGVCVQACTPFALRTCDSGDKRCWRRIRVRCLHHGPKFCQPVAHKDDAGTCVDMFPYED